MNGRYLYKAKRLDNGEWVEGFMVACDERIFIAQKPECNTNRHMLDGYWMGTYIEIDPSTICQCTGLKDKNGKLIWENDIVLCIVNKKKYIESDDFGYKIYNYEKEESAWSVEYKNRFTQGNGFYFYGKDRRFSVRATQSIITNCNCEVIGNIFDNPELLEV